MKTMKKYFKVVLCFIAFAVCSFLLAFGPSISAVEAAMDYTVAKYNVLINSINMPKDVDLTNESTEDDAFTIPVLNNALSGNAEKQVIRVIDPSGHNHDYEVGGTSNDEYYFGENFDSTVLKSVYVKPLTTGKHKVVYIVTDEDGKIYYSNTYAVNVKGVSYQLDLTKEDGLTNLFPKEVAQNSEIIVPTIKGKAVEGNSVVEIEPSTKNVVVRRNGIKQTLGESDFKSRTLEGGEVEYYITASVEGVYTIQYSHSQAVKPINITIKVTSGYVANKNFSVNKPTLPPMELGKENIELPKLTINTDKAKDIDHNITKIEIVKETDSNVKCVLTNNNYTFNFKPATEEQITNGETEGYFTGVTDYNDMKGIYKITYHYVDAYGNPDKYTITTKSAITVSETPKAYLSYDYDVTYTDSATEAGQNGYNNFNIDTTTNDTVVTDYAETSLKNNYGYAEISVPAIYGTDSITNTEDLIFVRYLRNANDSNKVYYVDNLRYDEINDKLVKVEYGKTGYNYALNTIEYANEDDKIGSIKNDSKGVTVIGNPNKAQAVRFSENGEDAELAGTYYLEYKVISNNIKERTGYVYTPGTTTYYSIEVLATPLNKNVSDPKISITNLMNSTILPQDGLTVKVAPSDTNDSRLMNIVFYYTSKLSKTNSTETIVTDEVLERDIDAARKLVTTNYKNVLTTEQFKNAMINEFGYEGFNWIEESEETNTFVIDEITISGKMNVVAVALNDNARVGVDTVTMSIKEIDDAVPPVPSIAKDGEGNYLYGDFSSDTTNIVIDVKGQSVDVKLPTVIFADDDIKPENPNSSLQMNVMYYIVYKDVDGNIVRGPDTGKTLDYRNPSNVVYGNNTIDGGTITTSETGTYYVVYTAIDAAGNTSVMYFTFDVKDSSNPNLFVEVTNPVDKDNITISGNTITAEVGATINFATSLISGDGNNTDYTADYEKAKIKINVQNNGLGYEQSIRDLHVFTFNSIGTYNVTITGSYDGRPAESKIYKVVMTKPNLQWLNDFDVPKYASKEEKVILPYAAASHDAYVEVNVTAPDGSVPLSGDAEEDIVDGNLVWTFTTNKGSKGTYKVKYTATNDYATIEKTFEIKVGDNSAPTVSMKYVNELSQDIVFDSEIEYRVNKDIANRKVVITATKNGSEIYSYNLDLHIKDIDDENTPKQDTLTLWNNLSIKLSGDNVTDSGNGVYKITGEGKCTLTITAEDDMDNVMPEEIITFNVVKESQPEEIDDTVVGTVLIVISLVILAGVILFFTFTGKKGSAPKARKNKKEEQAKEENIVEEATSEETVEAENKVEEEKVETTETENDAKEGEVE